MSDLVHQLRVEIGAAEVEANHALGADDMGPWGDIVRYCAAARKILAEHTDDGTGECKTCSERSDDPEIFYRLSHPWPCPTLLALAEGYGVTEEDT